MTLLTCINWDTIAAVVTAFTTLIVAFAALVVSPWMAKFCKKCKGALAMSKGKVSTIEVPQSRWDNLTRNTMIAEETAQQERRRAQLAQDALVSANREVDYLTRVLGNEISGLDADIARVREEQNRRYQEQITANSNFQNSIWEQVRRCGCRYFSSDRWLCLQSSA